MNKKNNSINADFDTQFVIKTPSCEEDIKKLAAFNGMIHDDGVRTMTEELLHHHPDSRREYWPFIEEKASGLVVSALCLIPWTLKYEEVSFRSAEMGIVGTHPDFRGKGLMTYLIDYYKQLLQKEQFVTSHIQGIPFFYSNYGYKYALPLETDTRLELYQVPEWTEEEKSSLYFTLCDKKNTPVLQKLYEDLAGTLSISVCRTDKTWEYLHGPAKNTETNADTYIVTFKENSSGSGREEGYFRVAYNGFGIGLIVTEAHALTARAALGIVKKLKEICVDMKKPFIRLNMSKDVPFMSTIYALGGKDYTQYAWQIRIADIPGFIRTITPVLEKRIAASLFADCSREFLINLYTECYKIIIEKGKITGCEKLKGKAYDECPVSMSYEIFVKLAFGYKSYYELDKWHPDLFVIDDYTASFLDILFPVMKGYLYTIY